MKAVKISVTVLLLLVVACMIAYQCYLNTDRRYDYHEIPGGVRMVYNEATDTYQLAYFFPKTSCLHGDDFDVLYTDENGIEYWRMYYYLSAQPWEVQSRCEQNVSGWAQFYPNGLLYGAYGDVTVRVIEICYLNSDGSSVPLWKANVPF